VPRELAPVGDRHDAGPGRIDDCGLLLLGRCLWVRQATWALADVLAGRAGQDAVVVEYQPRL